MTYKNLFIILFFTVNVILLVSYYVLGVNQTDFRNTPIFLHKYMLIAASLAYLINLWQVVRVTYSSRYDIYFQIAAISYYVLQWLFIPAVRTNDGNKVRLLLGICIIPIYYLYHIADDKEKLFSLYVLLHVVVNDFALYGFLHDHM